MILFWRIKVFYNFAIETWNSIYTIILSLKTHLDEQVSDSAYKSRDMQAPPLSANSDWLESRHMYITTAYKDYIVNYNSYYCH